MTIFINYLMFAVFSFSVDIIELSYDKEFDKFGHETLTSLQLFYILQITVMVSQTFAIYAAVFLASLIVWFTKGSQLAEVQDKLLGKKVPKIVFIQNQRLLKAAMKDSLIDSAMK